MGVFVQGHETAINRQSPALTRFLNVSVDELCNSNREKMRVRTKSRTAESEY